MTRILPPPPPWPGQVLRRPHAGYADAPTLVQPATGPGPGPDPVDSAGAHHAGDTAVRDPRGWWWTTTPDPADWRPPAPVDLDGPTGRLDPAAVTRTRREEPR